MIVNIYSKFKKEGVGWIFNSIYGRLFPNRLASFSDAKCFFENKTGLEIGGPSKIFNSRGIVPIYTIASRVDNCNFGINTIWEGEICEGNSFYFNKRKAPGRQYISEASDLEDIAPKSYDFLLSSHCIEHLANPLLALREWVRVLKDDGLLVLVVPHKDGTFDHRRPVTSLDHLVADLDRQTDEGDMTHLEEILQYHDLDRDPEAGDFLAFKKRSERNRENRCLHHHVFDTRLAVEMVHLMNLQILSVELFNPLHIIILAKRLRQGQVPENDHFRGVNSAPCFNSPFPSDQLHNFR